MKFPHLNLLFFIALLAFTSCEKEATAFPEPEPTEDASIGMRCCDQAVADMLEDPRFADFYDGFTIGVFDPIAGILDQFDSDELAAEFAAFEECMATNDDVDYCIGQSDLLTRLLSTINSLDIDLLLALQKDYDFLNPEEFTDVILEAIDQTDPESGRRITCFLKFRADVAAALLAGGGVAASGLGIPAAFGTIIMATIIARIKYCNCLYREYGVSC